MNYAFNRIKFNRPVVSCIAAQGKKKYNNNKNHNKVFIRTFHHSPEPNKNPFPSWKLIAILSGIGLYHQYKNQIKRE